jgi:hypothetical protein
VVFLELDLRDAATLRHVLVGAAAVAHCGSDAEETAVVVGTATEAGIGRVVVAAQPPEDAAVTWLRSALPLGRNVVDATLRAFTGPAVLDGDRSADRPLHVVHPDDLQRIFVRALLDPDLEPGTVDVAANGHTSIRAIAAAVGRPVLRVPRRLAGAATRLVAGQAELGPASLPARWGAPSWTAEECVVDFALACRGRITFGDRLVAVPGRLPRVRQLPAFDAPSPDGVAPVRRW